MMEVMYLGSILLGVLISSTLGYENLALNKPATMSSDYNNSYFPASKAVDGDRSREQLDCTFTGVGQTEAWWRVDLGALKSIVSINFTYGKTGHEAQLNPITRLTKGQNENDGQLEILLTGPGETEKRWGTICSQEFDEVDARVSCFGAGHLPDGAEYYTLDNHLIIWLSRLRCNGNEPSLHYCPNGIPGIANVDFNCTEAMDVGLRCKNGSTLAGFSVIVSETDNMADGQMCYHDTGTSIPSTNMDIPCKAIGRYVFFYNERKLGTNYPDFYSQYAYIQLAELEVYGCEVGQFGTACDHSCPAQCANSQCDAENANCLKCGAGYKSLPMCYQECDNGYFGENCALSCGNCKNNAPCHHITGRCEDGCSPGWLTIHCNESCTKNTYGPDCKNNCSENCFHSMCNAVTGYCLACITTMEEQFCNTRESGQEKTGQEKITVVHVLIILSAIGNIIFITTTCVLWFKIKRITRNKTKQEYKEEVANSDSCEHVELDNRSNSQVKNVANKTQVAKIAEESQYEEPTRKEDKYEALTSAMLDSNRYEDLSRVNRYQELSDTRRDKHDYEDL